MCKAIDMLKPSAVVDAYNAEKPPAESSPADSYQKPIVQIRILVTQLSLTRQARNRLWFLPDYITDDLKDVENGIRGRLLAAIDGF